MILPHAIQKRSDDLATIERELNALAARCTQLGKERNAGMVDIPGELPHGDRRRWRALCDHRADAYHALEDGLIKFVDWKIARLQIKPFRARDVERAYSAWEAAKARLEKITSEAGPVHLRDNAPLLEAHHIEFLQWRAYKIAKENQDYWSKRPQTTSRKPMTDGHTRVGYKMVDGVRMPIVECPK